MKRLREWYDGLAERERRLLLVFLGAVVLFVLLIVPYLTSSYLSSKKEQNEELREAIQAVQQSRGKLAQRESRRKAIEARYDNPAPALAGFIENAARTSGLEIPESQDRADVPHGKKFTERATVVRLRRVGMLPLLRMLEKIEQSGHPVVISRLNIRRRGREPDSYDVELGVSAFDTAQAKAAPAPPAPAVTPQTDGGAP